MHQKIHKKYSTIQYAQYLGKHEKRKRGVQIKYNIDEERKDAIRISKTKYMLNKEWYRDVCKNGHTYLLASKWKHRKDKMHQRNISD